MEQQVNVWEILLIQHRIYHVLDNLKYKLTQSHQSYNCGHSPLIFSSKFIAP